MMNVQPSRIARYVAGQTWGNPVQSSEKLAPGIFRHDTPGHGGIVAVLDFATDLTPEGIAAARASGRIETVAAVPTGRSFKLAGPSGNYREGALAAWAAEYNGREFEVWIGEEDCEYATILLASPAARRKSFEHWADPPETDAGRCADLIGVCQRWQPDFLEHFNPNGMVTA